MSVEGWFTSGITLSWTTDNTSGCDRPANYEPTSKQFHLDYSYH